MHNDDQIIILYQINAITYFNFPQSPDNQKSALFLSDGVLKISLIVSIQQSTVDKLNEYFIYRGTNYYRKNYYHHPYNKIQIIFLIEKKRKKTG